MVDGGTGPLVPALLFNLRDDPGERTDMARVHRVTAIGDGKDHRRRGAQGLEERGVLLARVAQLGGGGNDGDPRRGPAAQRDEAAEDHDVPHLFLRATHRDDEPAPERIPHIGIRRLDQIASPSKVPRRIA